LSFKQLAQQYINKGYNVTPVKGKAPFIAGWQNLKQNDVMKKNYNASWAHADGIALITGKTSNIVCLDIDILDTDTDLAVVKEGLLDIVGNIYAGRHGSKNKPPSIFYKYDGSIDKRIVCNPIKTEILSGGHACVLPDSLHPNGYKYQLVGKSLLDIDAESLPTMPQAVLDLFRKHNTNITNNKTTLTPEKGRGNHGSHDAISALGVALTKRNYPFDKIINRLIAKDEAINNTADYLYFLCPTRKWKSSDAHSNADRFVEELFTNHGPEGKYPETTQDIEKKFPTKENGFYYVTETTAKGKEKIAPDYDALSSFVMDKFKLKNDEALVYVWTGKQYESISFLKLKHLLEPLIKKNTGPNSITQFTNHALIRGYCDMEDMVEPKAMLNCNNGVVNIKTNTVIPHNPDLFFRYTLDHNYDPTAKCPIFLNSLNLVTGGDKNLQLLIQQIFGYCIVGGYPKAHKAFMFYGEGGNGKSTILTAFTNLVGETNTSHIPLTLFDKPFSMISMDGKLVNLIDETPKSNINPEAFKNVVSGGFVRAAHKGRPEIDLKVTARVIFACNKMPNFKDDSDGMLRRLVVIPFNHKIPDNEADRDIDDKIKMEMAGVLNFAIEGHKMLAANDYQFNIEGTKTAMDNYRQETDNVFYFFRQATRFVENPEIRISTNDLFAAYESFCVTERMNSVTKRNFSNRAVKYFKQIYLENNRVLNDKDRRLTASIKGIKRLLLTDRECF